MNAFQQTQPSPSVYEISYYENNYYYNQALHYQKIGHYNRMVKMFNEAIALGCVQSMYELGMHYIRRYYKDIESESPYLAIKYFSMAIEHGHYDSMYVLGTYYNSINDYNNMKFYYAMINGGNYSFFGNRFLNIAFNLGRYYQTVENNESLMLKHYESCFKHDDDRPHGFLLDYYANNILEYYGWLQSLSLEYDFNINYDLILNLKHELTFDQEVVIFLEKIDKNKTNIKQCVVCHENNQHIDMYYCPLGHEVCVSCYCKIDRCYYRCGRR